MPSNPWVEHVKKFAKKHNTTYPCAIANIDCKNEYRIFSDYKYKGPKDAETIKFEKWLKSSKKK